jgi:HEPN domain-containing protein
MSAEPLIWLRYAEENLRSAQLLLAHGLLNPCLQNAQQAVEKSLKAVLIARAIPLRRTHSIQDLANTLAAHGLPIGITAEEGDLLDAIYLPSKYPLGSALPDSLIGSRALAAYGGVDGPSAANNHPWSRRYTAR